MKVYTKNEFIRLLVNNGYKPDTNCRGKHRMFTNGTVRISMPDHSKELSKVTTSRIIKQYDLKED